MDLSSVNDFFVPIDEPEKTIAYPGPNLNAYNDFKSHINQLLTHAVSTKETSFDLKVDGFSYRAQIKPSPDTNWLILRRNHSHVPSLRDIGIPGQIYKHVCQPSLKRGGLILVCGQAGHGKSTTCASIVKERLEQFGGVCNTIENPVELPLNGIHGEGLCLQRGVKSDDEFREAVSEALRCYPTSETNLLLIGEILDDSVASSALRSSVNGHLVITTMHAGNVIQALQRLISLASLRMGEYEARELLGNSISMVIQQKLRPKKNDPGKFGLDIEYLCDTDAVVGHIKNHDLSLEMLSSEAEKQKKCLHKKIPIHTRGQVKDQRRKNQQQTEQNTKGRRLRN